MLGLIGLVFRRVEGDLHIFIVATLNGCMQDVFVATKILFPMAVCNSKCCEYIAVLFSARQIEFHIRLPMTSSSVHVSPATSARALLKELQETFSVFRESKPLAIGIDKQLFAAKPHLDKKTLRLALKMHTESWPYLKAIGKTGTRFSLDGTPAGEIEDAHRARASEMLRERFKKAPERKRNQQEEEKAEQRRVELLRQLTEKFSPRR